MNSNSGKGYKVYRGNDSNGNSLRVTVLSSFHREDEIARAYKRGQGKIERRKHTLTNPCEKRVWKIILGFSISISR